MPKQEDMDMRHESDHTSVVKPDGHMPCMQMAHADPVNGRAHCAASEHRKDCLSGAYACFQDLRLATRHFASMNSSLHRGIHAK